MATLCANNRILTIFNDDYNVAYTFNTKSIIKLANDVPVLQNKSSQDPYFGLIRYCSAISHDGNWYAVATERNLIVWSTADWHKKCVKNLCRSASKLVFTPSNDKILVADKTGDVYSYSIFDDSLKNDLLLGHLSILLDILMTPDEKFVITCDRDEKIRVTNYPNTYNVERFCLGHDAFVTKILILYDNTLLSGSGDGTLRFWDYLKGECLATHCVKSNIGESLNYCIITNFTIFEKQEELIVCVSVFKFDGILVYSCGKNKNYELVLVQIIDCYEPLDFVACESVLWILKYSSSCLLKALSWNENERKYCENITSEVEHAVKMVNENCASIIGSCLDISVLHKKFDLKEKSLVKKVKLN